MLKLEAIRVRNLRSLSDTGFLSIKPITVLVGKNSSGKSTFARCFPLLRQSVEADKRSPILWYGRLVDFGSFSEALSENSENDEIEFSFRLGFTNKEEIADTRYQSLKNSVYGWWGVGRLTKIVSSGHLDVSISLKSEGSETFASKIRLEIFGVVVDIILEKDGFVREIVSPKKQWQRKEDSLAISVTDKLIPRLTYYTRRKTADTNPGLKWVVNNLFQMEIDTQVSRLLHSNTRPNTKSIIASKIPLGTMDDVFNEMLSLSSQSTWHKSLKAFGKNGRQFQEIYYNNIFKNLPILIDQINITLSDHFSNIRYIEPLRATAQRYYRQQDLAVGEIDSQGANIAMFLESLTPQESKNFSEWLQKLLGFSIKATKDGGHISLKLTQENSIVPTNLADMGFGFSQVLPIAAQLWASTNRSKRSLSTADSLNKNLPKLIVIEQPELHLHPEFQSKLADVFVLATSENEVEVKYPVNVIIETHSPNIINRFGQLIEQRKISKDDIQIIIFDHNSSISKTEITISKFNADGILQNWPYGFFEPS
jgi:predicted ATPase